MLNRPRYTLCLTDTPSVDKPFTIPLHPAVQELFLHVRKSNSDRYAFKDLAAKVAELKAAN